jgi:hypothetical protein
MPRAQNLAPEPAVTGKDAHQRRALGICGRQAAEMRRSHGDKNVVCASQDAVELKGGGLFDFLEGASAVHPQASSTATHSAWRGWFAWRPVFLETRIGNRPLVWFRYVERRWTEGKTSGLEPRWIYRRARMGEGDEALGAR